MRTYATMLATAVTVIGLLGTAVAHASAPGQANPGCPAEHVCFFPEAGFNGTPTTYDPWNMPWCGATPIIAKSVYNNSRDVYSFYTERDCNGHKTTLNPTYGADSPAGSNFVSWR